MNPPAIVLGKSPCPLCHAFPGEEHRPGYAPNRPTVSPPVNRPTHTLEGSDHDEPTE